ncbi:hypothetical protein BV96_03663 [Sphingomonas paucimobilis]|nr:hypothetical protein BV96_03663 [Sphingomonas paucimobilis]
MALPSYCALSQAAMGIVVLNTVPIVMSAHMSNFLSALYK